jgi:hypothetical protein
MSRQRVGVAARSHVLRAAVLGVALGANTACYTTHASMRPADPGQQMVVSLNDRGRASLVNALGANADRVEGSVVSRDDSSFVLAVRNVRYFGTEANSWNGERVTVPIAGVRSLEERRFSKARTWLVVGAAIAGVIAIIITRSVLGDKPTIVETPGGGPQQGS